MKGKRSATTSFDLSLSSSSPSSSPPPAPSLKRRIKSFRRNFCSQERRPALVMTDGSAKIRSSIYRGVTRHRWTGRYEAHLWDKNYYNPVLNKRGRQVYLGAYEDEKAAAHTYDLAALKFWGPETILNFPAHTYAKEYEEMQEMTREEHLAALRRKSSGFARGVSKYRGVAQHHHNGRWEARIGRIYGNKYLYLGTFSTQEEAAKAYDMAAIEYRGPNAVTNFEMSRYLNFNRLHSQLPPSLPEQQVQQQSQPCTNYNHDHELVSSQLQYDYNMAKGPTCDIVNPDEQKASDGIAQQPPRNMQCVANFPSLHFPDFKLGMDSLMASSIGTTSNDIRCVGADHSLSPLVVVEEEDGDFDIDNILVNCDHIYSEDSAEVGGDEELGATPGCY